MRSRYKLPMLVGALLASAATSASAFEETRGSAAPPAAVAPAPAVPSPQGKGLQLELGGTGTSVEQSTGTEVRIPGLGKLGVLPKLDFGLELLYGVNEKSLENPSLRPGDPVDDSVGVRGTLRHRF